MKKILFVSSESVPFVKTGGLADVAGTLPRFINKEEYDVRIILPKYACLEPEYLSLLHYECHFYIHLNWRRQYVGVFKACYEGITYYFIDNEFYFAGQQPYNNIFEDVEKFAYFSKAVLAALPYIDFSPDIIHCNDWQSGLLPVFLRTSFGDDTYYAGMKTVMTIHNMEFQGRWKLHEVVDMTGLPAHIFGTQGLESYGVANCLKGGLVYANAITTVSQTYANDIMTPEGGVGLDGVVAEKKDYLYGILNGLDYSEYNPMTDSEIAYNYSLDTVLSEKIKNKLNLQKERWLPQSEESFLVGIVSRMTSQKGFDLIVHVMEEMLHTLDIQFVVLGSGEYKFEQGFEYFCNKYPDKVSFYKGYSQDLAKRIYASADAFLMPSLFEPCGLSQMIAMRYGTIPIVRETGGLKDTVIAYNEYENTGTGFTFTEFNAHDMMHVIKYALSTFKGNKNHWNDMIKRCMQQDFSWEKSAQKYENIYDKLYNDE